MPRLLSSDPVYLAVLAIALAAVIAPFALFPIPPLIDYPSHLARQVIIHDLLTRGTFSTMYQLHFAIIPNLGMEAIVLPLLFLGVPAEIAGRLFLAFIVVLLGTAVVNLHRTLFGKPSFFPLLSFIFLFNPVLMLGFANYIFGVGLALHGFAWWLRSRRKPALCLLPLLLVWAAALFFCHLMAVALFLGLIFSYEVTASLTEPTGSPGKYPGPWRTLALVLAPIVAVTLLYRLAPLSTAPQAVPVHSPGEVLARIPWRLKSLPLYLIAYSPIVDAFILVVLAGLLATAAWLRRLSVIWPMATPLVGLMAIYALVPETWAGTDFISYRLPIVAAFLFFSSVDIAWDRRYLSAAAVPLLLGMRTATVLNAWSQANAAYKPMLQAMARLPARASIYNSVNYRGSFEQQLRLPWAHLDAYAAIRNGLFVRGVWADPTQNWIVLTPRYSRLASLGTAKTGAKPAKDGKLDPNMFNPELLAGYDFMLAVKPELYPGSIPTGIHLIARSGDAALYSLHGR